MRFICFDTEDDSAELMARGESGFKKRVTQIAALDDDGDAFYSKGNVKDFCRWLKKKRLQSGRDALFVYAHNVQYDIGNLFANELDSLDTTLVGGRVIRSRWEGTGIIFNDSFNLWPMSVRKLAPAFGMKKAEMDVRSRQYVFGDVEIIMAAVKFVWEFAQSIGLSQPPPTLGGLCVKFWRWLGGENCHDSNELSREALYGGRVELFKVRNETEKVTWTDINSLYPFVMMAGKYPAHHKVWTRGLPEYGVATATVKVKESDLTVLPYRRDDGRIFYPWGKFTGTWTVAELRMAEANGVKIQKVHAAQGSNEFMRPYAGFVERLYNARLASKSEAEKLFFKLLMNNLYGRLATTGVIGRTVWQTERNRNEGVCFGEKVLVQYSMPLSVETNWSHAAHVTAYGRAELLNAMKAIGCDRMIYADTDSTIFDGVHIPFGIGTKLGEMKVIERSRGVPFWSDCETYAPKMYHADDVWKAKGVPVRLAKQFVQIGHAEFDLPFKMREAIKFFDRKNSRKLSVWRTVTKSRQDDYDRKILRGNRYFPCKVDE